MVTPELSDFLAVLRGADGQAVERLLRRLDPTLRRIIRLRLIDGRLRHALDTADIFQSLLKDFLSRRGPARPPAAAAGGLCAYLAAAARRKIWAKARKERRHAGSLPAGWEAPAPEPPAARQVEDRDFSQAVRGRLPEPTRRLFDLKAQGLSWAEIAAQVGGQPDALRMRLRRAVAAALGELGHGELSHAR
jgi:RNA polymerase sigma factor (sigma-70 family)